MSGHLCTIDSDHNNNPASMTHDIRQTFSPPIATEGKRHDVAITGLSTYYSWYNISAALANNAFKYYNGAVHRTIVLADGVYSYNSLVSDIYAGMIAFGDATEVDGVYVYDVTINLDLASNYVSIAIASSNTVDFASGASSKLGRMLGFNAHTITATKRAEREIDMFNGVNELVVCCNLVEGMSRENGAASSALYTFSSNTYAPQEIIEIYPPEMLFVGVNHTDDLRHVRVWLRSHDGPNIDLNGAHLSVSLYLRPSNY